MLHSNPFISAKSIGGLRMIDDTQTADKIVAVLEVDISYDMRETMLPRQEPTDPRIDRT